jgi:hypothetical protein
MSEEHNFGIELIIDVYLFLFAQTLSSHPSENTFGRFGIIVLFHTSFFIFITTIGLNIILGIIVDTFSELRNLKVRDRTHYYHTRHTIDTAAIGPSDRARISSLLTVG